MTIEPLACPYCNALVPAADGAAIGQHIPCPRCGEGFTVRRPAPDSSPDLQQTAGGGTAVVAVKPEVDRRPPAGRNKWLVAGTMLGVMAVMAAVALAYALYTQPERRDHDQPPMQEALRWLPPDSTVIAGVRVADLNRSDAGRDLLNHLFQVGKVDLNADMLQRWTGLNLGDIDLFVVGVRAEDGLAPRTVVVVRTLRPYDAEAVKKVLAADPAVAASGKALFRGKPQELGLRPVVWFADARTLVFGALEKHLDAMPDRPAENLDALPPAVKEAARTRARGHRRPGLGGRPLGRLAHNRRRARVRRAAAEGRRAAGPRPQLRRADVGAGAGRRGAGRALKCDGDDAAEALEARLTAAKPAGADWKTDRQGPWLTVQMKGDPFKLFKDLAK